MTDILFGNNNRPVLKLLAKRSLKAQKNTIAVLAIMLATLLFTSLFTIAISLQTAMQESNMRTTGTSAHAGIKRLSWEEYERLSSDTGVKDSGYSIIIGNAVGDKFNKTPTELRYGDETYAELTFNNPDTGHLPEQKNEIATSRIVLAAMGLPDEVGTQMELTFITDTDTFVAFGTEMRWLIVKRCYFPRNTRSRWLRSFMGKQTERPLLWEPVMLTVL